MKFFITWVFVLAFLSLVGEGREWFQEGNPVFLTSENLESALEDKQSIKVIKMFAPFCGYCRYLKHYVDEYKKNNIIHPNLKFYQINCQETRNLCAQQFGVRSYPVMMIFDENANRLVQLNGLYPQNVIHNLLAEYNVKAKELAQKLQIVRNIQLTNNNDGQKLNQQTNSQKDENSKVEKQSGKIEQQIRPREAQPQNQQRNSKNEMINNDQSKIQNKNTDSSVKKQENNKEKVILNEKQESGLATEDLGKGKYLIYLMGALFLIGYGWHIHKSGIMGERHEKSEHENSEHDKMEQNIRNEEEQSLSK